MAAVAAVVETAVVTAVETVGNSKGAERPPFFLFKLAAVNFLSFLRSSLVPPQHHQ